jgi:5-formyltetrahydrofolate cyclo-ligase
MNSKNKKNQDFTKNIFRKSCQKKLVNSKAQRVVKDSIIIQRLLEIIHIENPKNILLFIPLHTEPNVLKVINRLRRLKRRNGVNIYVPYMTGESFEAVLYRLPLRTKQFGIKEPAFSKPARKIDLAVVPVIGYDASFRRVGFGKGMYDRFFASYCQKNNTKLFKKPVTVFVQRQNCYSPIPVTDAHDIQADYIVS